MTTNTPAPALEAVLTDDEITNVLRRLAIRPGDHDFNLGQCIARAIESALMSKLRAPVADERAAFELAYEAEFAFKPIWDQQLCDGKGSYATSQQRNAYRIWQAARAALASAPVAGEAQPNTERDLGFNAGICVALQVVTSMDCGVTWREIVTVAGKKELLDYAANVEPEEWELAGFKQYAMSEMNERKPRKRTVAAAPQASEAVRILFPAHLRKMWSGGEVQAWLDEHQGITAPKPSAKGSLERYRKWQAERDEAFGAGVNAAADLVKKMVDDYDADLGSTDPETGSREYPGEGATWVCEMQELEESIRALSAQPGAQKNGGSDA